ncbi:MAG TPA: cupin domain-containing protein [Pirellulales bacterium]
MLYLKTSLCTALAGIALIATFIQAQSPAKSALKTAVYDWTKFPAEPTKSGERRLFFDGPTATLAELDCHATTINPGAATHPPQPQPNDELIIVREGALEAQVDGHPERFGQGSILFQAAGDLHGVKNVGDTPATYYVIKIVPKATQSESK